MFKKYYNIYMQSTSIEYEYGVSLSLQIMIKNVFITLDNLHRHHPLFNVMLPIRLYTERFFPSPSLSISISLAFAVRTIYYLPRQLFLPPVCQEHVCAEADGTEPKRKITHSHVFFYWPLKFDVMERASIVVWNAAYGIFDCLDG